MHTNRTVIGRWVAGSAGAEEYSHGSVRRHAEEWLFQALGNELG